MVNILSTGTAMNIAVTTGDAGQLGMVAGFDGYFNGLITRLIHPMDGLVLGDSDGDDPSDLLKGDALRGDRLWGDLLLSLWRFLGLVGCLTGGDRLGRPYPHYFSQHSVYQH
ncbi:hypothetical protein VB780_11470 [Leptolyngbya sp. CCNP1308]|uniref:hypothetical protein n=1 Tax=Leptolyngbya sp. CCNP1308 TaxID=3110255 RepID=UPI002B1ECFCD|nr:hypothetical protein [Leptolyngbya sp. CCNP1308]MEA5449191.1 hypothetical protein [Leptolyngbya sp. CCNP1308]